MLPALGDMLSNRGRLLRSRGYTFHRVIYPGGARLTNHPYTFWILQEGPDNPLIFRKAHFSELMLKKCEQEPAMVGDTNHSCKGNYVQ